MPSLQEVFTDSSTTTQDVNTITEPIRTGPVPPYEKPQVLERTRSHISGHEIVASDEHPPEIDEEIYNKFSSTKKMIITSNLSLCGLLAPIASTSILSAIPEVSKAYNTSGAVINVSQAAFLIGMGVR